MILGILFVLVTGAMNSNIWTTATETTKEIQEASFSKKLLNVSLFNISWLMKLLHSTSTWKHEINNMYSNSNKLRSLHLQETLVRIVLKGLYLCSALLCSSFGSIFCFGSRRVVSVVYFWSSK